MLFSSAHAANPLDQDSCGFFLVCPKGGGKPWWAISLWNITSE